MTHYDGEILVDRIRNLCREKGISVAQMEKDLTWSQGLISRWTKNSPSVGKIMEVVHYLGVSYEELLGNSTFTDNNNSVQETLSQKLYRVTNSGKLFWSLCDKNFENIDVQNLLEENENCKVYCTVHEKGFFLLIINHEEEASLELGALRSLDGRLKYPIQDADIWTERLLELIDESTYEQWDKIKTTYFIEQFMQADF